MALPVRFDVPVIPPVTFDINNPPAVPPITNVPPTVANIIHMVSAAVCNEASMKAFQSQLRMFCYNLLVDQYWHNPAFAEVVKLTLDMIALEFAMQRINRPDQGIVPCAEKALALYTSNLVMMFPELKQMLDQRTIDLAYQNMGAYNALRTDIANMYSGHFGAPSAVQPIYPQQQGYPAPQVGYQQQMYPSQGVTRQYPTAAAVNAPTNTFGQAPASHGPAADAGSFSISQYRYYRRITDRQAEPVPTAPVVQQQVISVPEEKAEDTQKYLNINGGSEMARGQFHIQYFGDAYSTDSVVRNNQLARSVSDLEDASAMEIEGVENHFVHPSWVVEHNLETAIVASKVMQFEHQQSISAMNLFRNFVVVANPVLSIEDPESTMKSLRKSTGFHQLAVKMAAITTSMAKKTEDRELTDTMMTFLSTVDITLTGLVNRFLEHNLVLDTRISSFVEDVGKLFGYLETNYGDFYKFALEAFESDVMETMFNIGDNDGDHICNLIKEQMELPEGLFVATLPVNYSLTHVFMNDKELGYVIEGDKAAIINPGTAPYLYSVVRSLREHKKQIKMTTLRDLFITADGVRYELFQSYLNSEEYFIKKA